MPGESNNVSETQQYAVAAHLAPFLVWIVLMVAFDTFGNPSAGVYALQTGIGFLLFVILRPWRWYAAMPRGHLGLSLSVGVLVFLVWVLPEIRWGETLSLVQEIYLRYGILPLVKLPQETASSVYAPETCGWLLTGVRLAGSAFVIAVIEEFFWRGFLYRWLIEKPFTNVRLDEFDLQAFFLAALIFGFEHQRWVAGMIAGACYAYLMIRTRSIWTACIAHCTTNLLLGIFVIATRSYHFW